MGEAPAEPAHKLTLHRRRGSAEASPSQVIKIAGNLAAATVYFTLAACILDAAMPDSSAGAQNYYLGDVQNSIH